MPANPQLELAHVLFTDIVGYSRLLNDEQREAIDKLNELIRQCDEFRRASEAGRLKRLPTGDGVALVFFTSPEAPVQCAIELTRALKDWPELPVRMGVHTGPVNEIIDLNEQSNVSGGGINIAQRVMDCGDAGHILLSKRVGEDLAQYRQWKPYLHDLGEVEVKHGVRVNLVNLYGDDFGNPQTPAKLPASEAGAPSRRVSQLRVWLGGAVLLALTIAVALFLTRSRSATAVDKSIAVLPFDNLSDDPDNAYFAAGIQDEIITRLSKIAELKVISCTSTQRFKSAPDDLPAIAKQLGVANILEGSVQRTADQVRVNVQLIKAETHTHLWADTYDRRLTDIFAIETDIAKTIAEMLQAKLTGSEQHAIAVRPTENTEAHQFYLKGRYFWNKRTADNLKKAIDQFQQATERDPNYALGYVGLADCYVLLEQFAGVPASESMPKARAAADRALQLEDSLAEAHTSSAFIYQNQWRWAEAEEEFKRAISLNPNYPTAHHWFARYFLIKRQFDDAIKEGKQAQKLDPLSPAISVNVAIAYLLKNDPDSAIEQCQRVIDLDPSFPHAHDVLGFAYLKQRRYEEAIAEFQQAVELSRRAPLILSHLGYCYAVTGRPAEALAVLKGLDESYARREATGQHLAGVYAGLGDRDQAFAWLERDFQQRSGRLPEITYWFSFEELRSDPRYADLFRRMGLQP